mmetsp:Transcript_57540/g.86856  ORF Transcript_57540/g.86856 Transcript_57540/m.86856 type:complete len:203 (+) Transcript_57540:874-1482(+)
MSRGCRLAGKERAPLSSQKLSATGSVLSSSPSPTAYSSGCTLCPGSQQRLAIESWSTAGSTRCKARSVVRQRSAISLPESCALPSSSASEMNRWPSVRSRLWSGACACPCSQRTAPWQAEGFRRSRHSASSACQACTKANSRCCEDWGKGLASQRSTSVPVATCTQSLTAEIRTRGGHVQIVEGPLVDEDRTLEGGRGETTG